MEQQNTPWEAISAQLKKEATEVQRRQIEEWLDLSPDHAVILSEIMNTWSLSRTKTEFYEPDMSGNWNKLMQRIDFQPGRRIFRSIYFRWVAAAAVLVIVFLAGIGLGDRFVSQAPGISYTKIIAPEGNKTQIVLPDSTHVWLNSGSEIQYPSDYSATNRSVSMRGECFFDVVHDPQHPFLVRGSKFQVKVFGTRFNVHEDDSKSEADVTLVSGKVQVLNLNNQGISELKPGQQFIFSNGKYTVKPAENIEALTAWLNNMLIFDNQPFEEVIHYLENWYGVKITLDQSLYYSHNYTFKVKTESLREVLELISVITPIEYHIDGEQVTIKYKKR
ncbi:MAG: FecR domain-containing protein [Prolixibacteraceae bacterium]|jgi:ferric-dicitrate binding protein FerR (iron transport regulator)